MSNNSVLIEYKTYLENNDRSPKTIHSYMNVLGDLSDFAKGKPFKEISAKDIGSFLQWKKQNKVIGGRYPKKAGSLSKRSYALYVMLLKIFYRWLYKLPKHQYPSQVSDLDVKVPRNHAIKPSEVITKEDVATLMKYCSNFREKALVGCLYESACRVSEFLGWRIGDIVFDRRGAVLNVRGKTGERRIRLIESVPQLQQWLETHPNREDRNAWVWSNGKTKPYYMNVLRLLRRLFKKAKLDKPANPHAFRHSRLTELAKFLSDAKLKVFAGWVGSSRMSGTYVHLSGADLDADLLRAAGVETEVDLKVSPLKTKRCSRCDKENSGEAQYCSACGLPFDPERIVATEIQLEETVKSLAARLAEIEEELKNARKT